MLKQFHVCDDLNQCVRQLNHNPKLAVAISREHVQNGHLLFDSKQYCFDKTEIIHDYPVKFLVRKGFPHTLKLNEFLVAAIESGLIENWRLSKRIRYQTKKTEINFFYLNLNNDTLYGGYIIYSIMGTFLFVILASERIIHTFARRPNCSKFWRLAERFIDPHRHFLCKTKLIYGNSAF